MSKQMADATGRLFKVTHPHADVWEARPVDGETLCIRRPTLSAVKRALATLSWLSAEKAQAAIDAATQPVEAPADEPQPITIRFHHNQAGCAVSRLNAQGEWVDVGLISYGDTLDTAATEKRIVERLADSGYQATVQR